MPFLSYILFSVNPRDSYTSSLMDHGSLIWASDSEPYAQLREGAISNDITLLKKALEAKVNVDVLFHVGPRAGSTSLHEAARRSHADAVRYLIDAGANIDINDKNSSSQFTTPRLQSRGRVANADQSISFPAPPFRQNKRRVPPHLVPRWPLRPTKQPPSWSRSRVRSTANAEER